MKKIILLVAIVTIATFSVNAQVSEGYKNSLTKLFEVAGSYDSFKAVIKQSLEMQKQMYPGAQIDWGVIEKEFLDATIPDLVNMLVPVYVKYFTQEDIEALIAFYETPIGKKYALNNPALMQESMIVGQQWGQKIGLELQKRMSKKQ